MYPSKGSNPYGQQPYGAQQAYGQIPGSGYTGNQVGGPEGGSQHALAARQSSMMGMGATQDTDMAGYRNHPSQASQYGGPYASVYGSSTLSSAQQVGGVSGKAAVSSSLQGRATYPSALAESSKFSSGAVVSGLGMTSDDYLSASNRGYTQKVDQFSSVKNSDYASMDRRHYSEHQGAYIGRELQSDSARRYGDSVSLGHPHQSEMRDPIDQTSLLRQQQMMKAQSLQSGSDMRQADYYAVRAAPIHHGPQEVGSYGGRMDADPRSLSILGSTPYGGQHAASILGGAPRRNVDDIIYAQGSSSSTYGVGLPPGRDYVAGKGLRGPSLESDYQGSVLSRGHLGLGVSMLGERKDDRNAYRRELEIREEERRRELMREREKEREREERDRERDRECERDRLRERRDKERERDRKRLPDSRRERTPPRATRDRRGSSTLRDEKPLRRVSPRQVSPRREAVHRHRSPVKEKKREYICKVYPFCLVDVERDYLSLSKRCPRLAIAPDFSKVVLNWPRETLNLSLHTPVSFEHDILEVDDKTLEKGTVSSDELLKSKSGVTVWNAKVILISGISSDALNELCSDKSADERIMHFNNILKFAVLRKDRAFMAIGGSWNMAVDGGDPAVDDSSLIQTAIRYVKDLTQLELHNCQHWNRFLEIHYDRVGEDGLFSHKEVTVLFVPDLSECLPSVDLWRNQWLAHKDLAEKERRPATKQEKKSGDKKEAVHGVKGDENCSKTAEGESAKILKAEDGPDGKAEINTDGIGGSKKNMGEQKGKEPVLNEELGEEKIKGAVDDKGKIDEKIIHDGSSVDPAVEVQKPAAKKKTIRKIVKTKVVGKKVLAATVDAAAKLDEKMDVKDEEDKQSNQDNAAQEDESSAELLNVKTFARKKVVRKVALNKPAQKEDKTIETFDSQTEKKPEKETELQEDEANDKKEQSGAAVSQVAGVKTSGKKKIIRKVIKRKVSAFEDKDAKATNQNAEANKEDDVKGQEDEKKDEELVEVSNSANKTADESEMVAVEKESLSEKEIKEEKKDKKESGSVDNSSKADKGGSKSSTEPDVARQKDSKKDTQDTKKERIKDEKEKNKDVKHESKQKLHKEGKKKGNYEEPPKHPGFLLQTKRSKGSKIRSMSLSLDGLLDYNDKDVEESTFELSLFAESFNEMLQYQMGCRILSFLEKLRRKFVLKRNQRKRQRDEDSEKGSGKEKSSIKRPKTSDDSPVENESLKSKTQDTSNQANEEKKGVDGSAAGSDEPKMENKTGGDVIEEEEEELEDPEEVFEEDQEMDDAAASDDGDQEDETGNRTADLESGSEKTREDGNNKKSTNEKSSDEAAKVDEKSDKEKEEKRPEREKSVSVKDEVVDKELLQAFRFFDRNRVDYIKVEDLRCIIHNMGKFLSNRDVKEFVQSALFESNSARDNRIFYKKLVRLTNL